MASRPFYPEVFKPVFPISQKSALAIRPQFKYFPAHLASLTIEGGPLGNEEGVICGSRRKISQKKDALVRGDIALEGR